MDNENIRVANEWPSTRGYYELTLAQKQRKRRGKSFYERDKQVTPYEVRKGKWA